MKSAISLRRSQCLPVSRRQKHAIEILFNRTDECIALYKLDAHVYFSFGCISQIQPAVVSASLSARSARQTTSRASNAPLAAVPQYRSAARSTSTVPPVSPWTPTTCASTSPTRARRRSPRAMTSTTSTVWRRQASKRVLQVVLLAVWC